MCLLEVWEGGWFQITFRAPRLRAKARSLFLRQLPHLRWASSVCAVVYLDNVSFWSHPDSAALICHQPLISLLLSSVTIHHRSAFSFLKDGDHRHFPLKRMVFSPRKCDNVIHSLWFITSLSQGSPKHCVTDQLPEWFFIPVKRTWNDYCHRGDGKDARTQSRAGSYPCVS